MDDGAPALDALQLGRHLDARKALDVSERQPLFATLPHDTHLPGIWFEVGRQPLGAIHLRLNCVLTCEHKRQPGVAEVENQSGKKWMSVESPHPRR